ncbi:uncharacterized protein LOC143914645 [Arctopsyche grandis]|uniref:uncharacterized protein LOC143914645 n=1 Tax=Arctopsyche grandis TaxID=121162 RepID=UPI00406D6A53
MTTNEMGTPKEEGAAPAPNLGSAASTSSDTNVDRNNDEWWKAVSTEAFDCQKRATELLEELLLLRVEATKIMIEFASIHGTNFRYFQDDDDEDDFNHPALAKK